MLFDRQALFSDAQDIGQVAASYPSTNVYDLLKALPRQPGSGEVLKVEWIIIEGVTSAGAATIDIQLVSSAATDLSTPTVHASTGAQDASTATGTAFTAGKSGYLVFPRSGILLRYVGLLYVIATATTTAGTITAGIVWDDDTRVKGVWTGVATETGGVGAEVVNT